MTWENLCKAAWKLFVFMYYDSGQVAQRSNSKNLRQSYLLSYQLLSQKITFIISFPSFLCLSSPYQTLILRRKKNNTENSSSFAPWNSSKFSTRPWYRSPLAPMINLTSNCAKIIVFCLTVSLQHLALLWRHKDYPKKKKKIKDKNQSILIIFYPSYSYMKRMSLNKKDSRGVKL